MHIPRHETILSLTPQQPDPISTARSRAPCRYCPITRQPGRTTWTPPLPQFAQKVAASNRLLFADLRRLQRDVLPNDITSRDEAEILIVIDQTHERADETSPLEPPVWVAT